MVKQLKQMQDKMLKAQQDLANETVTATAGGGAVTVEMNGHHEVKSVKLDPAAVDPADVEMLEELLVAGFNEALEKAQTLAADRMNAATGGMNLPGLGF